MRFQGWLTPHWGWCSLEGGQAGRRLAGNSGGGRNEATSWFGTRFSPGVGVSNPLIQDCFLRIPEPACSLCPSSSPDTSPPEA